MSAGELDLDGPARLLDRAEVGRLLQALAAPAEETRIVGGAVRNALLGRAVHEIDLATTAPPQDTMRRARAAGLKAVPTGIEHGTVTVIVHGTPFEVTTLREDVETDGRRAVVRFGRSFEQDALRRDFTINALSLGPDGQVRDYTGGVPDLAAGRVRFIGDPRQRIREDFLRVLRFFRFSADYAEGPLDPEGLDAAIRERDGLSILSRERIRAELLKLLSARRAAEVVATLSGTGLLLRIAGEVPELGRLRRASSLDAVGRLAALHVRTEEDAERLRDRLRLSNAEHDRLATFARLLGRLLSRGVLDRAEARRIAALHGAGPLVEIVSVLAGEPRPVVSEDGQVQVEAFRAGAPAPAFRLTGRDLIGEGVPPGPQLGRRLAELKSAWLAEGCPD
ncbi:CCA tRNA nucleotidyltransferase [Enterovirga aerilata]|uniref:CCA tRNA nucleotidyltransferase n=1 Tax=Enterovirga aerilata TaxID=2730920 RepID=A0A849HU32_9HYPH|nr:CCA tRNA nucleotidyltransferase [Enterovirga sp. DB1703]NNM71006.1 CCA tRNA nucleotidyltransferase [Enterovirga sp. DB1703]